MTTATRETETSHYPEDQKSIEIPQVAASERGPGQSLWLEREGVRNPLERGATAGDSPRAPSPAGGGVFTPRQSLGR